MAIVRKNPKEVDWQYKIIESTKKQCGYGKKWSSTYAVGVPDLILSLPTFGAFFMEVKLEHSLPENFDRQIGATKLQQHTLASLVAAGARAMLGVVLYHGPRDVALVALPPMARRVWAGQDAPSVPWRGGQGFNVNELMRMYTYEENENER